MPINTEEIRRRRQAAGYTLQELGERAGFSGQQAINWWNDFEKGRFADPRVSTLQRAAHALNCRIDDLLLPFGTVAKPPGKRPRKSKT